MKTFCASKRHYKKHGKPRTGRTDPDKEIRIWNRQGALNNPARRKLDLKLGLSWFGAEALPRAREGRPAGPPSLLLVSRGPPHGSFTQPPTPDSAAHPVPNLIGPPGWPLTEGLGPAASWGGSPLNRPSRRARRGNAPHGQDTRFCPLELAHSRASLTVFLRRTSAPGPEGRGARFREPSVLRHHPPSHSPVTWRLLRVAHQPSRP